MRGNDEQQGTVFSSINPEERIPADRPLRSIGAMVDGSREELWAHFEALYARRGRRSIPPEKRLWAVLLQLLDSIRRERPLFQEEKFIAELRRRKVAPHGAEREPNPHWRTEEERHD